VLTVLCVLKSGGVYDATWVEKLKNGVDRNLKGHRFVCMSDVDVPCETIPLENNWTGWWSKIEMFRPGVISGPTLYLDLDTVITGPLFEFTDLPYDFAMLESFHETGVVGSGVMWFGYKAPEGVYERFSMGPLRVMDHYHSVRSGSYRGDQAFIWDTLDRNVDKIASPALRSYKMHCLGGLPKGTSIVCFHGRPRPTEVSQPWMDEHWK
jgi:hypothetical protein